jgi:hypothetical protein
VPDSASPCQELPPHESTSSYRRKSGRPDNPTKQSDDRRLLTDYRSSSPSQVRVSSGGAKLRPSGRATYAIFLRDPASTS